ncbi:Uncharacterized protein HZ326_26314 [Fusarium oxysporum f. sp. albedinis]|nr:Uncharacterized protein HZ326_26314 [Fusarium oxysporum f. sp. albedinis]
MSGPRNTSWPLTTLTPSFGTVQVLSRGFRRTNRVTIDSLVLNHFQVQTISSHCHRDIRLLDLAFALGSFITERMHHLISNLTTTHHLASA